MQLDDMKVKDIVALASVFGGNQQPHPLSGRRVLAILAHGFVYFGTLRQDDGCLRLGDAANLRYWKSRDGGLPEFAAKGPVSDDRIDQCADVFFNSYVALMPLGEWK